MARQRRPEPPPEPRHGTTSEGMIRWSCRCGGSWYNEQLKGKTDEQLIVERDEAFLNHVREMERQGYA